MIKVDEGCFYMITIDFAKPDLRRTQIVLVRKVEKEKDGKRYVEKASGRFYLSMTEDTIRIYLNDNDNWKSYVGQLEPARDKKEIISNEERGVHHLMIKTIFAFNGKYVGFS